MGRFASLVIDIATTDGRDASSWTAARTTRKAAARASAPRRWSAALPLMAGVIPARRRPLSAPPGQVACAGREAGTVRRKFVAEILAGGWLMWRRRLALCSILAVAG